MVSQFKPTHLFSSFCVLLHPLHGHNVVLHVCPGSNDPAQDARHLPGQPHQVTNGTDREVLKEQFAQITNGRYFSELKPITLNVFGILFES